MMPASYNQNRMLRAVRACFRLVCLFLVLLPALAFADNLVVNGGFETGDFTGWNVSGPDFGVTDFVPGIGPHSGVYAAEFQGVQSPDILTQSLSGLIPGQGYTLSFYVADIAASSNLLLQVQLGNLATSITSLPAEQWVNIQLTAIAQAGIAPSLIFQAQDPAGAIYLDDISVTPSPEPAPLLLCVIGFGVFACTLFRFR
jgi:Carbohydrate binding domain